MYTYRINLALKGRHFAKVVLPIGTTLDEACTHLCTFKERFPEMEVTMTEWSKQGREITP